MTTRRAELLLGLAGALGAGGATAASGSRPLAVAAAALFGALLGGWRRHVLVTSLLVGPAIVVAAAAADAGGDGGNTAMFLLIAAHAFCAGRWDARWRGITGLAIIVVTTQGASALTDGAPVPALFVPLAAWGAARALREREVVAGRLAERARELAEEREAYAALSVRYERARIASELHDIVAHAISVMVVQASAGQRLAARDPDSANEVFATIAGAARQAEQDMGRLVALLGDEGAIGPAPDLALVEELVRRASGSGLDVTLRLEGERTGLPADLVETAYRVVQEGLTNALRYAAGAAVHVLVRAGRDVLEVEVVNGPADSDSTLAGIGTGTGLLGLRERAGACGGTLEAGPTPDGGWRLAARLARRASPARVTAAPANRPAG